MLSKSQISFIKSLHQKKYRKEQGLFCIEGIKSILEFLNSNYELDSIFLDPSYFDTLPDFPTNIRLFEVNLSELTKISSLQTPQGILATVKIPQQSAIDLASLKNQYTLVVDDVQDPGNLGTIIRTADWFGIKQIICSLHTVEAYNPKTVQATMGSLARVKVIYTDLADFFEKCDLKVYGAVLGGNSIYEEHWEKEGLLMLGNEGHGISSDLEKYIDQPITIPKIGNGESLNVAISAAIICSELGRLQLKR